MRDQVVSQTNRQQNITTWYITTNPDIPKGGLTKAMLNFAGKLDTIDIIKNQAKDRANVKMTSLFYIDQAIGHVLGKKTIKHIFRREDKKANGLRRLA